MELTELLSSADFEKQGGLLPAVVQDSKTRRNLMLGYMNKEAIIKTFETGRVNFFSRSKQRLWMKGETSGNYLQFKNMDLDCDKDTLLVKARPVGPVCHTGSDTCWNEANKKKKSKTFMYQLEKIVHNRIQNPIEGSYTNRLLNDGVNRIAKKFGEEAVEVVIEAKDDDDNLFLNEMADLMYHATVLLAKKELTWAGVEKVLAKRHK